MSTRDVGLTESRSSGGAGADVSEGIRKTVLVDFTPAEAFDLFTHRIAKWWPVRTHSYGGDDVTNVVFEPEVGGRVYEVTGKGEQDWARVVRFEPPSGFLLEWLIGDAHGTEVEVTFTPEGPGARVVLEHRGFGASDPRDRYGSGWDAVLTTFVGSASKNS